MTRFKIPVIIGLTVLLTIIVLFIPRNKPSESHRTLLYEPLWFINFNENVIEYRSIERLSQKFAKLVKDASEGKEQLRILHIGDSHIQADFFTGETRRLLSSWLTDTCTSRGFTFPYQIASSNNPDDFDVTWVGNWVRNRANGFSTAKLGVAGISLTTSDKTSEFTVLLRSSLVGFKPFDKIRIFYDSNDSSIVPLPSGGFHFFKREIGAITYDLDKHIDKIRLGINWNDIPEGSFTLFGIDLINSSSKVAYHAAGVNGASVRTFLQSENFEFHAHQINPQLVIVSLGTNDSYNPSFKAKEFRENLSDLVKKIKYALPNSMIILTTPGDHLVDRTKTNPFIDKAQAQIYYVAKEHGCGVWDFYKVMGGAGSIGLWAQFGLSAPDNLHLNRNGYKLQGALLFDALVRLSGEGPNFIIDNSMFANE